MTFRLSTGLIRGFGFGFEINGTTKNLIMAFTKITPEAKAPSSPDILFRELPRRKFPDVLPHQQAMMQKYAAEAQTDSDVALQLPTGSGKTLVGLLIAEWRRRKNKEKIVYLCPTRQLVNQVVQQAEQKYGLSVVGFTGSKSAYAPSKKAKYSQAECVAITTYSSLFNTNPYFSDADVIVIDDAHAAENYVAKMWTMSIDRNNDSHKVLHDVVSSILKPHVETTIYTRIIGEYDSEADMSWVDKLPTPALLLIHDELIDIFDTYTAELDLRYSWSMLRTHLLSCHIYLSLTEIVIRPILAPTWAHDAFSSPKQRLYMSATLGEGGDLERLVGRKNITRLPVPDGWDLQGVGRRFFMFPSLSLSYEKEIELRRSLLTKADRSLILVPSEYSSNEISTDIDQHLTSHKVYSATDIEQSKDSFVTSSPSVAVIANRYDGIDFAGDECRLLCIEGLPKAVNLQERFFMSRMGANILFNERIQTRVLQAIGRCTRSLEDYSAVVVSGAELPDYLSAPRRREHFHPELQAELWFGVEQSKDKSLAGFEENFDTFIENGPDWESVNQMIVDHRNSCKKVPFPGIDQLAEAVRFEVDYQVSMWQKDYVEAVAHAESVIGRLVDGQLRGYRALWEYLAGSAAILAFHAGNASHQTLAKEHFIAAKKAATGIPWLVKLSQQSQLDLVDDGDHVRDTHVMLQVEKIEATLQLLGTRHDRNYTKREQAILEGLTSGDSFEEAHELLGEHLGYDAGKIEAEGSPDPWWQVGSMCIVFEDHANANETSSLSVTKARQANSHPDWMRTNVESCKGENVEIISVLVTPISLMNAGAVAPLGKVYLWKIPEFRTWASTAMFTIRELRKTFTEPGDLVWRVEAATILKQNTMDIVGLMSFLKEHVAKDILTIREANA